ncbi:probable sugar phosphate phosphate translocator At2g25520 [Olea europaea subsp. europaea]|uniref:Probable sugar phosphate phosphate translocator At2g25520 n=1 Tax=Olea europaea subsp. europaea TaxID=158383 RepID=A0A8S0PPS6_OLEEU|nr:probable sugar phosphate phosphate translocator At2g25520 [Olea europaea subsp. europaea]
MEMDPPVIHGDVKLSNGVAHYNYSKLQSLKATEMKKKAQAADEEAGKLLEERKEGGMEKQGDASVYLENY